MGYTVAVDFDGTLHPYSDGWVGQTPADEPPVAGAEEFLLGLRRDGFRVVVLSARCSHPHGLRGVVAWLERWDLSQYVSEVTATKPGAVAYVDDRAIRYQGDWTAVREAVDLLVDDAAAARERKEGRGRQETQA